MLEIPNRSVVPCLPKEEHFSQLSKVYIKYSYLIYHNFTCCLPTTPSPLHDICICLPYVGNIFIEKLIYQIMK